MDSVRLSGSVCCLPYRGLSDGPMSVNVHHLLLARNACTVIASHPHFNKGSKHGSEAKQRCLV